MKSHFLSILVLSVVILGCGKKEEKVEDETPDNAVEALQQFAQKAEEMQNAKPVDPVDFRKLKELLPESAGGLKRTEASGEKNGAAGFTLSQAEGKYSDGEEAQIEIEIMDTGGIAGVAALTVAGWSMAEIDKETETGYEKTTKIDGYKAFEKYDNTSKFGEINLLVGNRYIVNIKGDHIEMDKIKSAVADIKLDKLAELK